MNTKTIHRSQIEGASLASPWLRTGITKLVSAMVEIALNRRAVAGRAGQDQSRHDRFFQKTCLPEKTLSGESQKFGSTTKG